MPPKTQKKNLIEHFDDGILDLSLTDLVEVPIRDIAAIPKATTLDLSSNRIAVIPKNFPTSLTHLVKLDLCQNQLTELPENFGLLVHLKHLDLYGNKLTSLPLSFGSLKVLRWLDLKQNPLMPKLAEVAGPCLDAVQCQRCAKDVVTMLGTLQSQVEAERLRRQELKQKEQEQIELEAQAKKLEQQQQKKKKKKLLNNSGDKIESKENGALNKSNNSYTNKKDEEVKDIPVIIERSKRSLSLSEKIATILNSVLKFFVISTLAIVFIFFLMSLMDEETSNLAHNKLNHFVLSVRKTLPTPVIKQWDMIYTKYLKNVHITFLKRFQALCLIIFQRLQKLYTDVNNNTNFIYVTQNLQSWWHFLWIKSCDLFRTVMSVVASK